MYKVLNFIFDNSSIIKDYASILFTLTATILAVLTYRRAKATILQPKRNEVIKIQSQLFINFLESISKEGNNIDSSLDYLNVFRMNLIITFYEEDIIDKDFYLLHFEYLNETMAGWYDDSVENPAGFSVLKGNLDSYSKFYGERNKNQAESDENLLKKRIFITKSYWEFINELRKVSNSPFLPDKFKIHFDNLFKEINNNLFELIPLLIYKEITFYNQIKGEFIIDFNSILKEFEENRTKHSKTLNELREDIKLHLNINDKW